MKPGKPFVCGKVGESHFFGLPGNPVSAVLMYGLLVQPALQKLRGMTVLKPAIRVLAIANSDFKKKPGRVEFQRGLLMQKPCGKFTVTAVDGQGSHQLLALSMADCLVELEKDSRGVFKNDSVMVRLL